MEKRLMGYATAVIACCSVSCTYPHLTAEEPDSNQELEVVREGYGTTTWGMEKDEAWEVAAGSDKEFVEGGFITQAQVADRDAMVVYLFIQNRLSQVAVVFDTPYVELLDYFVDFGVVRKLLDTKYGEGDTEWVWLDEQYRNDPDNWGRAVALDQLAVCRRWHTDQTYIEQSLTGQDYPITHKVLYISRAMLPVLSKAQRVRELEGL